MCIRDSYRRCGQTKSPRDWLTSECMEHAGSLLGSDAVSRVSGVGRKLVSNPDWSPCSVSVRHDQLRPVIKWTCASTRETWTHKERPRRPHVGNATSKRRCRRVPLRGHELFLPVLKAFSFSVYDNWSCRSECAQNLRDCLAQNCFLMSRKGFLDIVIFSYRKIFFG